MKYILRDIPRSEPVMTHVLLDRRLQDCLVAQSRFYGIPLRHVVSALLASALKDRGVSFEGAEEWIATMPNVPRWLLAPHYSSRTRLLLTPEFREFLRTAFRERRVLNNTDLTRAVYQCCSMPASSYLVKGYRNALLQDGILAQIDSGSAHRVACVVAHDIPEDDAPALGAQDTFHAPGEPARHLMDMRVKRQVEDGDDADAVTAE